MKKMLFYLPLLLCFQMNAQNEHSNYDKALAEKLGADDYGMKMYTMVILKSGPNKTTNKVLIDSLFRGHMDNITRLVESRQLVVAGPMMKNDKTYRGIFILDVKTNEEALELLKTDPAISEKLLEAELYQWYGSAALPEYLPSHEKVQKMKH